MLTSLNKWCFVADAFMSGATCSHKVSPKHAAAQVVGVAQPSFKQTTAGNNNYLATL
jgi:hypothetical protein